MIADDLAAFYETNTKNLMRQVRRNLGRFPEGFIFQLTEAEYQEKLRQNGATSQGKRADLTHYGFTEKGALQLSSVLTGPVADAVSVTIINAFIALRDAREERFLKAFARDEASYMHRSKIRIAIKIAAEAGWTFGQLWEANEWSAPRLGREIEGMRSRGYIQRQALYVPPYVFARRRDEAALMDAHAEEAAAQPDLFDPKKVH
ncbi:MAG: ORF6N domain-containing protein [Rhodobacterales bacterium]|nr:ORF6N domain-containing protein [Rhodobacterales bacterium]